MPLFTFKFNIYLCRLLILLVLTFVAIDTTQAQKSIQLDERENYAKLANNFFHNEDWDEGKRIIDEGLFKYPDDSDLRMLLGKYYFRNNEYDKARYELMQSLERDKNNVSAKQILINVEIVTKRYSSAICYINELLEVNPYWKGLWKKKMEVYRLQGNKMEANRLLNRMSQIYPDDDDIRAAYTYYLEEEIAAKKSQGEIGKVIDLSSILIEKEPYNEEFYLELINNCLKAGKYKEALAYVDRGLHNLPNSIRLIDKKADIMAEQHRYSEVLDFLKLKTKNNNNRAYLERRYNYFLEESARHFRKYDPYTLYSIVFEQDPHNQEAFNYVYTNALSRGLYDDALVALKAVKDINGDTKELLLKEQVIYDRMGLPSRADQIRVRLYEMYPDDSGIRDEYTLYRVRQAKNNVQEGRYQKALPHWLFVAGAEDAELRKTALSSLHNCYYQLGYYNDALDMLQRLRQNYPDEHEWSAKIAVIYGKQGKYKESLHEYERAINLTGLREKDRALLDYDELAVQYTKQLIEEYDFEEASQLVEQWLNVIPSSEMALYYAVNISSQTNDSDAMIAYAAQGMDNKPDNLVFRIKMAQAHNLKKQHALALGILDKDIEKNPYHKELVNVYSQSSEEYANVLIDEGKIEESLNVLNKALIYDPDNKTLNYWKGIAHEKNKDYDSAYQYMLKYEPSLLEVKTFSRHLSFLKSKTYKNVIGVTHLRSRFGEIDQITTVSTLEYTHFAKNNTYTGRVNYTGREEGKGIQGQAEWGHVWCPTVFTRFDIAVSSKYFSKFIGNAAVFKTLWKTWEAELAAGYRKLADHDDMFNAAVGFSKELDPCWLNARFNNFVMDGKWYYSLLAQARYYIIDNGYLTGMASIGSAPDVDIIDNQLYNGFSVTNSMVGLGGNYLLTDKFTVGLLGTWYNYEDYDDHYRNLYNIYLQLYVSF